MRLALLQEPPSEATSNVSGQPTPAIPGHSVLLPGEVRLHFPLVQVATVLHDGTELTPYSQARLATVQLAPDAGIDAGHGPDPASLHVVQAPLLLAPLLELPLPLPLPLPLAVPLLLAAPLLLVPLLLAVPLLLLAPPEPLPLPPAPPSPPSNVVNVAPPYAPMGRQSTPISPNPKASLMLPC